MPEKPTHSPIPISPFVPDLGPLKLGMQMGSNLWGKLPQEIEAQAPSNQSLSLQPRATTKLPNPISPRNLSPPKHSQLKLKKLARVKSLTQTNAPTRNSFGQRRRAFPSPLLFHEDPCSELPWVCPCHSNSLSEDASPKCVFLK